MAGSEAVDRKRAARRALPVVQPDGQLASDALELHRALSELIRVYQFRDRDRICCYDVSVSQCYALEAVIQKGPLGVNALAAELFLDKSTASRVVDALENKGYVERRADPADGRALQLVSTRAGRSLHRRIEADILAQEQALLAGFPADVRRSMTSLIGQLAQAASGRVDTSGGSCCTIG